MSASGVTRRAWWVRVVILAVAVGVALGMGIWQTMDARRIDQAADAPARKAVVEAAQSTVVTLLSYTPDNAETQLKANLPLLTGDFHDSYDKLISDVVIPGAREKNITATAQVPAAAVESLTRDRAQVIAFINQSVKTGTDAPKDTASSVRIGMRKIDGRWLIEAFDPL